MIGKHYKRSGYNCANLVADWYEQYLGVNIPVINEFDRSFMVWMRRNFTPINSPEDHCLVLMTEPNGGQHIGVYHDYGVTHNFKPNNGHGSVCKWTLGSIHAYYPKVSFHKWSQSDILVQQQVRNLNHNG